MGQPPDPDQGRLERGSPAERERLLQSAILRLLLMEHPAQLTLLELRRELGDDYREPAEAIEDAVRALVGAGLAHRQGDFVVPSRAARYFDWLSID